MSDHDLSNRLANLSPTQRMALFKQLQKKKDQPSTAPAIPRRSQSAQTFPCSFAQQRLWFLDQYEGGSPLYNIPYIFRIQGQINPVILQQVFDALVSRHESLRTTFATAEGMPVQVIVEHLPLVLKLDDLRDYPLAQREALALDLAAQDARQPFDLKNGPLVRTRLFQIGDERSLLLLNMHHIISDGWSMSVLVREIAALYEAFVKNQPSPLPDLPIQYVDFTLWQREWLQGDVLESQLNYWRTQLANVSVLQLPLDRSRPAIRTSAGQRTTVLLPKHLVTALEELAQREGATLFMVLLAAFNVLLYRYSDEVDIPVGTAIANRHRAEVEGLIGMFVNTLVLRTDLSGNPTFRTLVQRVRKVALAAYDHQDLPFERLVEALQPVRDLTLTPLFQVLFVLQNAPLPTLTFANLTLDQQELDSGAAQFDLTFSLQADALSLQVMVEYNTDLFDAVTIDRLVGHFRALLEGIIATPDSPIASLPLLSSGERQLLDQWNQTDIKATDCCLHELVEAQAARIPDAVAVICGDQQLTYAQLNQRATLLAQYLRRVGVGTETLVGLCMERSVDMLVGILGILNAGGIYVPLDPGYPRERLAYMIADAQLGFLILDSRTLDLMANLHDTQIISLDRDWATIVQQPDTPEAATPTNKVTPDHLAYIIYTSGSTGQPKGVQITHRGVVNVVEAQRLVFDVRPGDRVLQFSALNFDASIFEIVMALCTGATLCVAAQDQRLVGDPLLGLLRKEAITHITFPPSVLGLLTATDLPALRVVISAGEPYTPEIVARWAPQRRFFNAYGPTEATIWTTVAECWGGIEQQLIGKPIPNVRTYVLSRSLQRMPVGTSGELYIGGVQLARAYHQRPDLTAERFLPDPFSKTPGARLYKTGDLARWTLTGQLEYLGRNDDQVKLRGFRIELGEIESVLNQHPAVQQAVVIVREDAPGDKRLVAYVVEQRSPSQQLKSKGYDQPKQPEIEQAAGQPAVLGAEELNSFAKNKLPAYMVPSAFVVLEAFPLTPNGKIDRGSLPAPDTERPQLDSSWTAPRTPTEEHLSTLWADILNLKHGVHDNFFDLGGHSLSATQMISRIRDTQAVDLPVRTIFEAPTIAELAQRVEAAQHTGASNSLPPTASVPPEQSGPLSFAQEWLIKSVIDRQSDPSQYITCEIVRLEGPLDLAALEQALNTIVRRQQVFRTRFEVIDGQYRQIVGQARDVPVRVVDLQEMPARVRSAEVQRIASLESHTDFDLGADLLLRPTVIRLDQKTHVLLLAMPQLVCDSSSIVLLLRELSMLYAMFLQERPPSTGHSLPELSLQYIDFAVLQRQPPPDAASAAQLAYWSRQLQNCPPGLDLLLRHPSHSAHHAGLQSVALERDESLTQKLQDLCKREGVSLFMALLTAFNAVLFHVTGQTDLVVSAPILDRQSMETSNIVGCFANSVFLRVQVAGTTTFRALLKHVQNVTLDAYANQDVDVLQVMQAVNLDPRNYAQLGVWPGKISQGDMDLQMTRKPHDPLSIDVRGTQGQINMYFYEQEGPLQGALLYDSSRFDTHVVEQLIEKFHQVLDTMVRHPDHPITAGS